MNPRPNPSAKLEIGVLYGFRALMVLFVMNYHLWQQSWISQTITVFGRSIGFDYWTRSSYLFVDGMILLSAFLLYLPYARQRLEDVSAPSNQRFYFNRAVRILPSYLFAVLAMLLFVALPQKLYHTPAALWKDLISHLTFTFLFRYETYVATPLNVALWTIAVEVQFYLIFPLIKRGMQKRPLWMATGLCVIAWAYRFCVAEFARDTTLWINQMPAFLDVYALGMLAAMAFCRLRLWVMQGDARRSALLQAATVLLFVLGVWVLSTILRSQSAASLLGYAELRLSQMRLRLPIALTLGGMMLCAAFWPPMLQKLLDNRLMRFLSAISMNLYIWHQVLAVQMRLAWFPDMELLHTDKKLQSAYMLLCVCVAVLTAMVVTFGWEQPISRLLNRRFPQKKS